MKSGREEENDSSAQASASVSWSFSNSRSSAYETESPSASTSGMVYDGGQSLASILNNPSLGKSGVYSLESGWWALNSTEPPPIVVSRTFPEISKADFQKYLDSVSECYSRFEDVRQHSTREKSSLGGGKEQQQGDALLACLREIPSLYFMENFALEDGNTFQAACPFNSDMPENNTLLQEKLSHYLDIVEVQLVKEISLRSDSFFEAQGQLQDLNGKLVAAFAKLRELKDTVKLLDADLVQNARQIQTLSRTRAGLVSLHEKLKLISYVYQSLSALKLLISAADCASALDVIDDLQQVQENNDLVGLHCFRHLSNQLASSLEAVNNILAADFVRVAIHDAKNLESTIIATFRVGEKDIVSIAEEDILMKIKSVDDPSSGLRDRLLPLVIGLLRTAKLPAVLRVYRDTLIADIKASIKTTVAELLPLLLMQASECEVPLADRQADRDGGGSSMASKLRSLSAQSFVWLLTAIFRVVQMHLIHAAEIKKVIEWIMGGLDGYYAADAVAAAFSSGVAIARAAEASHESDRSLLSHFSVPPQHSQTHVNLPMVKNDVASPSSVSRNFRADVLRENTEAVLAACDAAHARWAKLLGVRALVHPKLRLQDFLSIYNISQEFLSATEKVGGRLGYSIRGSLQSQCKAFIDYQHTLRVTKLSAVLDQETWVAVDVPNEFQAIVYSFGFNECSGDNGSQLVSDSIIDNVNGQSAFDQNANQVENVSRQGETEENSMQSETAGRLRKGRDKSTVKTLSYQGIGYHMVNSGIILLKMISEYIDIANALPNLASDVVHRVADILKHFNSRTCHLVLGAGAMQVSRLKSITAKHLALASQTISFFHAIIPDVKRILLLHIPEVHKTVLVSDIDKIQQDYKVHRDEIHLKLVQIMKERLQVHLRMMPQIVESWNKQEDKELQPSQIARNLTKEVGVLQRVISPILHEMDVQMIFRQVVQNFHVQISDAFSKIDVSNPHVKNRLHKDAQHILQCIRSLPTDIYSEDGLLNPGELDNFVLQRFGHETMQ